MAAGALLRLALFPGTQISDDLAYNACAHRILEGTHEIRSATDPKPLRWGILLPIAGFHATLGAGEFTGALLALVAWPCLAFLLHGVMMRISSPRAAIFATLLSALCPLDVLMSTTMFPEVPVTMLALGALLLVDRGRPAVAGVLIGVAYLMKENAIFWIPALLLWIAWRRAGWKPAAVLCASALAVFVAECAAYAAATGDPFFRIHVNQKDYLWELDHIYYPTTGAIVRRVFLDLPLTLLHPAREATSVFGGMFLLAAVAARRRAAGPLLLFAGLFVAFNFFPARIWPYMPNTILARYLYPLLIPCYMIVAIGADRLKPKHLAAVAAPVLVALAWFTHAMLLDADNRARCARLAARRVDGRVHADPGTAQVIELVSGYRTRPVRDEIRSGDWVIVNTQMEEFRRESYGETPRTITPSPSWILQGSFTPRRRFRLRTLSFLQPPGRADLYHIP